MKNILSILQISILLIIHYGCDKMSEQPYFAGNITVVDEFNSVDSLKGERVELDGLYTGYMSVCDSIIHFLSSKFPVKKLQVFNLNSKLHMGSFIPYGEGPDDFTYFTHAEQYVIDNQSIKLWGCDLNNKYYLLNLTQSVLTQSNQIDSVIELKIDNQWSMPFSFVFVLDENFILAKNQPERLYSQGLEYLPGSYHLYNQIDKTERKTYKIYNKPLINNHRNTIPYENFL